MRTNSYEGSCDVCGDRVPAGKGALTGPPWRVKCLPCSGEVAQPAFIKVNREDASGDILFEPSERLGDLFHVYVTALNKGGARYDGSRNRARPDQATACIAELEKAEFLLKIHPSVSATLQAFVAQHKTNVAEAGSRADKIDAGLRERGLALYPFQKLGVEWLAARHNGRGLLADEMGLGKTIQALAAIPTGAPVLVVGPLSSLGTWARETPIWRQDLTFTAVGRNDFHWPAPGEMVFCTYDSLPEAEDYSRLGKRAEGTVIIGDEIHKAKYRKGKRAQRWDLARQTCTRTWILTGSPLLNEPPELWNMLQCAGLANEAFGNYWKFCDLFGARKERFGTSWGSPSPEVPALLRKVMLRRKKAEVLPDLPTKTYQTLKVSIGPEWDAELAKCVDQLKLHVPSVWEWLTAGPDVYEEGAHKPGQPHGDPARQQRRNSCCTKRRAQFQRRQLRRHVPHAGATL